MAEYDWSTAPSLSGALTDAIRRQGAQATLPDYVSSAAGGYSPQSSMPNRVYATGPFAGISSQLANPPAPTANERAYANVVNGQVGADSPLGREIVKQFRQANEAPAYDWTAGMERGLGQAARGLPQYDPSRSQYPVETPPLRRAADYVTSLFGGGASRSGPDAGSAFAAPAKAPSNWRPQSMNDWQATLTAASRGDSDAQGRVALFENAGGMASLPAPSSPLPQLRTALASPAPVAAVAPVALSRDHVPAGYARQADGSYVGAGGNDILLGYDRNGNAPPAAPRLQTALVAAAAAPANSQPPAPNAANLSPRDAWIAATHGMTRAEGENIAKMTHYMDPRQQALGNYLSMYGDQVHGLAQSAEMARRQAEKTGADNDRAAAAKAREQYGTALGNYMQALKNAGEGMGYMDQTTPPGQGTSGAY